MTPAIDLTGRAAVVTGASRGIGEACARALADAGARVVLVSRSESALRSIAADLANDPVVIPTDLANEDDVRRLVTMTLESVEGVDILVNNAGLGWNEAATAITAKRLDLQLDLNLRNVILLTSLLGTSIQDRRGTIVNMSSVASMGGGPDQAVYAATKGGLDSLTRTLAGAWGKHGVRVNALAPGYVDTDIWSPLVGTLGDEGFRSFRAATEAQIPLRRWATPAEIAVVVLFLCSDLASYVTGQVITVDGGGAPG